MSTKPLYSKIVTSREFNNRETAEKWGKEQKASFKQAGQSIKTTTERTLNSGWRICLYAKV